MAAIDASTPVVELTTVTQAVNTQLQDLRLAVLLLSVFTLVAVVLAATGIYGVITHTVAERTKEIALRMIVGAGLPHVVWMVMADVMRFVGVGLLIGVGLAVAASRLLQSALFGVTPTDLLTYATVSALFVVIALIACLLPTWRAITINPTTALRAE